MCMEVRRGGFLANASNTPAEIAKITAETLYVMMIRLMIVNFFYFQ
jgi:hypothetical protein